MGRTQALLGYQHDSASMKGHETMVNLDKNSRQGSEDVAQNKERNPISWRVISLILGAVLAIPGAWILAAKTFEPGISLSSASAYFENFNKKAIDSEERRAVWDTMVTENYRKYGGFSGNYKRFAKFWNQQKRPAISHISKDGKRTFSVSLVFNSKDRRSKSTQPTEFAAVFVCDDWRAQWMFRDCGSSSLLLDDVKLYAFRVVEG